MQLGYNSSVNEPLKNPQSPPPKAPAKREWLKMNRLTAFAAIFAAAVFIAAYVGNVIKVNTLMKENQKTKKDLDSLADYNQGLKTRIAKLQSAERIADIAKNKLKMEQAQTAPESIR